MAASWAQAATYTWDADKSVTNGQTDGSASWLSSARSKHWFNGSKNGKYGNALTDIAVFGNGGSGVFTVTLDSASLNAGGITFNSLASGYYVIAPGSGTTLTLGSAANIAVNNTGGAEISAILAGTGGFVKTGAYELRLTNAASTITGPVAIQAGTLSVTTLANGGVASSLGASTNLASNLLLSGGATLAYTGSVAASTDRLFTIGAGGATIANNGTGALSFTNTGAVVFDTANQTRIFTLGGSNIGDNIFSLNIPNNGTAAVSFVKSGAGKWILNNTNAFTGGTSILAGLLELTNLGALGTGSVSDSGTLAFANTGTGVFANSVSGSGAVTQSGAGTTILTGVNTYSGLTAIAAGTLQVGNGGTAGSLGSGAVTNNAALIFDRSDSLTASNSISGTGSLTKNGAGALTLSGNSTYSGLTTVSAGTLFRNALATSSAHVVNSGATLGGTGTTGDLTLNSGAFLSPGATGTGSIGTLGANNFTWNGGGILKYDLGASGVGDKLVLGGALIKGAAGSYVFDFQGTGQQGQYTVISAASVSGFTATNFTLANLASGLTGSFAFVGNDLVLTVAIPEPAEYALGVVGASALVVALRRRKRARA